MNHRKVSYINPNAPVEATPVKRRRRGKLMFQEERQFEAAVEEQQDTEDYRQRQADRRGFKQ